MLGYRYHVQAVRAAVSSDALRQLAIVTLPAQAFRTGFTTTNRTFGRGMAGTRAYSRATSAYDGNEAEVGRQDSATMRETPPRRA